MRSIDQLRITRSSWSSPPCTTIHRICPRHSNQGLVNYSVKKRRASESCLAIKMSNAARCSLRIIFCPFRIISFLHTHTSLTESACRGRSNADVLLQAHTIHPQPAHSTYCKRLPNGVRRCVMVAIQCTPFILTPQTILIERACRLRSDLALL